MLGQWQGIFLKTRSQNNSSGTSLKKIIKIYIEQRAHVIRVQIAQFFEV